MESWWTSVWAQRIRWCGILVSVFVSVTKHVKLMNILILKIVPAKSVYFIN